MSNKMRLNRRPMAFREKAYNVDEHGWFYDDGNNGNMLLPTPTNIMKLASGVADGIKVKNHISKLFNDIGIRSSSQFCSIDVSEINRMTTHIGHPDNVDDSGSNGILSTLKLAVTVDEHQKNPTVHGFVKTDEGWKDATNGKIKTIDHVANEPLVCPACNTNYYDSKDVLFAQTAVHHGLSVRISHNSDDDIKLLRPHIALTPICPQCYLDKVIDNNSNTNDINISPVFTSPDDVRHIVPLLPKCMVDKLHTDRNANAVTAPMLFWPKNDSDILCDEISRIYMNDTPLKDKYDHK